MNRNVTPRSAALRRRPGVVARERTRAAEAAAAGGAPDDDAATFLTPNLPPLRGTASARRQFGYGAGMEPAPVRSPESDGVVDLGVAIQGALDRHEQQEATQKTQNERRRQSDAVLFPSQEQQQQQQQQDQQDQQRQQQQLEQQRQQEQDQATEQRNVLPPLVLPRPDQDAGNFRRIRVAPAQEPTSGSETDDARSFDLESDCFGDATILSSPMVQEPPGPFVPYQTRILTVLPPPQPSLTAGNEAPRSQGTPGLRSGPRRPKSSTRNTTNQGTQQPASDLFSSQDPYSPRRRKSLVVNDDSNSTRRTPLRQRSGNSDHGRDAYADESITRASYPVSLFDRDSSASTDPSTNPFFARSFYAPELSEMDDAMQQDIHSNSGRRLADRPPPQQGEQGWSWQKPIQSLPFLRRDAPPAGQGRATADTVNWWQLLNPYTYFQAVFWMAREMCTSLLNFLDRLYPQNLMDGVSSIFEMLLYFAASIIGLITVISVVHAAIFGKIDGGVDGIRTTPNFPWTELGWPGITHMADKAHELMPKLSWPTWSRSGALPDLTNLDSDGLAKLDEYLKQYQREFESLQNAGKLHESSLAKLEAVLPRIVHTPIKNGKVAVAPEFWYGMRDLIHQDNEILTFEKKGSSYEIASEAHWKAIAAQITRDPAFTKEISKNVDGLEERVKSGASGFWDSWVKSNDAKIAQVLGSALEQIQSAGSQKEFDKRLQRIVKEHMDESNKKSAVVSREEFLQHVSNEFATHRAEVRAELEQIKPKLEELVHQAAELARKDVPQTMTKAEIIALVQGMVKKAVANVNLDAMARGKIQAHWNAIFKHQVNYFGIGAGAIIDRKHSSNTFEPERESRYVKQKGIKGIERGIPRAALEPWAEEGDCWCAARSENERGNPHGAILAVLLGWKVAPQHITVEHIVAAATTDPGARPKEIEIYADVPEKVRDGVRAYSAKHFPDIYPLGVDRDSWDVSKAKLADRFVKIAQFVYEDVQPHDGVQVYKFSDELLKMGVFTDHIIVRAVSNYGAPDHTCFYRVRLFGQLMDDGNSSD